MAIPPDLPDDARRDSIARSLTGFFDAAWYGDRYPDVIASGWEPLQHYVACGAAEGRDPNRWFDSLWYQEHYPDVSSSGLSPLLHYLQHGAQALYNPHPRFDAAWYVAQHPEATGNPLVFHLRNGAALGYATEPAVAIGDYLPSIQAAPVMPADVAVDVIIPVYRGLAQTQACIQSVLADPDRPPGRIIVVDDASPEPALSAWLDSLAASRRIERMRNRQNQGFVVSANRGIAAAGTHDVVLLNSDTEVPSGWLRRLAAQAYAGPRIASVSPFSNNATICSYPADAGGPLPLGLSLNALDAICQEVNAGRSVELPTTVGFCMYIRRDAIREAGAFDAAGFGRGYGEENDFCRRTAALGWRHLLACDIFVYHEGGVSFGAEFNALTAHAMTLLTERYPDYLSLVSRHVVTDAVGPFRFAITAAVFRRSGLPTILLVSHALGGGVRRHILSLIERLAGQANYLLLSATTRGASLSVPALPGHPTLVLPEERLEDMLTVLRGFGVTRVHVHHLMGRDMDIRALIQRLDVPFDTTVHDYYGICPQVNLLPWPELPYCGEPDIGVCNACIGSRPSHYARDILSWRLEQAWQFLEAERVFCPSADVRERLARFGLGERTLVVPHEPVAAGPWPLAPLRPAGSKLRVALLGVLANHKGAPAVAALAEAADPALIELHLIGHTEARFPSQAAALIRATGAYDEAELPALLAQVAPHVLWFPSPWPETYSFTMSTAMDSGLPIVATRIGSFPERLAGRPLTWLVEPLLSTEAWLAVFDEVRQALRDDGKVTAKEGAPALPLRVWEEAGGKGGAHGYSNAALPLPLREGVGGRRQSACRAGSRSRATLDPSPPPNPCPPEEAEKPSGTPCPAPPQRGAVADYYRDHYLRPCTQPRFARAVRPAYPIRPASTARRRVLVIPERSGNGGLTPCAYIRLIQPLHHLAHDLGFELVISDLDIALRDRADIIATQRYAIPTVANAEALARHARATGAVLLYDLDDELLHIPADHPEAALLRPRAEVVRRMLRLADQVWVSSVTLATALAAEQATIRVIPNGLDERLWGDPPPPRANRFGPVRLLYMGTATHDSDLALVLPALGRIRQDFGDRVVIELMGVTHRGGLPPWISRVPMPAMAAASYPGFVNWITDQPAWEIGLAPLTEGPFNRCKSPIKTLDYAALGMTVLASDVPAYRGSLADGPGGMLVGADEAAWYDAIALLLRNARVRQKLAEGAASNFLVMGTLAAQRAARRDAFLALTPRDGRRAGRSTKRTEPAGQPVAARPRRLKAPA
jgi:GT2 family glycosyltransferase/glycosyltransferase involved in cell wall biosynthesis